MKILLFLALIVSSYSYAQSGHDHQGESQKKDDQHGNMHGGDHHGMGECTVCMAVTTSWTKPR